MLTRMRGCLCCSPATKIRFSRIEATVYPRVGKSYCFKHTADWGKSKLGGVLLVSSWTFGSLTLYVLMNYLIPIDKIKIVHCISI